MWFTVELAQPVSVTELQFESSMASGRGGRGGRGAPASAPVIGYPRAYTVQVSADGSSWSTPVATGKGEGVRTTITFAPIRARFVRITQTDKVADAPAWSIRNLRIYEAPASKVGKQMSTYSRRDFGKLALGSLPAASLIARTSAVVAFQTKPNSVWGGVPFGIFAPYRFGPEASDLDGALKALVKFGVSQTELSNAWSSGISARRCRAGAAAAGVRASDTGATGRSTSRGRAVDDVADVDSDGQVPVGTEDVRRRRRDGLCLPVDAPSGMPDAEYDYTFNAAKALGATQITMELPSDRALSQRIGDAAARHKVNVGYHLHTTATMTAWDEAMAQSPRNGLQLDIGHYVAGTGLSPVPLIEKHHARIFSMHLKDRKQRRARQVREHAVGRRRHADQGRPAGLEEEQVGDPRRHRVRVPGAGGLDLGRRNCEVRRLRKERAPHVVPPHPLRGCSGIIRVGAYYFALRKMPMRAIRVASLYRFGS